MSIEILNKHRPIVIQHLNKNQYFVQMFGTKERAESLAKSLAEGVAKVVSRMYEGDSTVTTVNLPDVDHLKSMTIFYADDIVNDFQNLLMEAIDDLFKKAKIATEVKIDVKIKT